MAYLVTDPIDPGALFALVQSPERGGVACFLGTVRNHHGGREVLRLEYSAYGPMAEVECERIVAEAESGWDVAVALRHRVGQLEIGDTAVAIAAASAHRDEAFLACRYVIEEVKRRVPIWKREVFADGTVEWVGSGAAGQQGSGAVHGRDDKDGVVISSFSERSPS
ncbi:MAG TPA: molybdenum cofactor biosynthesis protein MoaE [Gemmatimonadales bacterium]|jgi:molybdopterin synthase catalytic subunit|nr:molybdenum cofactor biosynthesis protein MoaE [Gemmatimonadales bacterium]